jgi:hypothetical protein
MLKWGSKKPLHIFMLSFRHDENINKIYEITDILGMRVEIHPIRKSSARDVKHTGTLRDTAIKSQDVLSVLANTAPKNVRKLNQNQNVFTVAGTSS